MRIFLSRLSGAGQRPFLQGRFLSFLYVFYGKTKLLKMVIITLLKKFIVRRIVRIYKEVK